MCQMRLVRQQARRVWGIFTEPFPGCMCSDSDCVLGLYLFKSIPYCCTGVSLFPILKCLSSFNPASSHWTSAKTPLDSICWDQNIYFKSKYVQCSQYVALVNKNSTLLRSQHPFIVDLPADLWFRIAIERQVTCIYSQSKLLYISSEVKCAVFESYLALQLKLHCPWTELHWILVLYSWYCLFPSDILTIGTVFGFAACTWRGVAGDEEDRECANRTK